MEEIIIIKYPINVIIADDEAAIRNGLEKIILSSPFEIQILGTASNGKDTLGLILQHRPDIAVIDINMPEMDGLEVIRLARAANCETRFFILSGYHEFSYAQSAIRYNVKYYFLKPLNILEFQNQFSRQCQEVFTGKYTSDALTSMKLSSLVASSRILFLNQLVQNKLHTASDILPKLSMLNLSITNTSSCVVILSFSTLLDGDIINLTEINSLYVKNSFTNFIMESWVYDENQILAIFNLENDTNFDFRSALRYCIDLILTTVPCKIIAGIGNIVPALSQCSLSFLKAQEAMSYHIYKASTDIYDVHIICSKVPEFSKSSINFQPIIQSITHHDASRIKDYCNLFFRSLFFIQMPPPSFLIGMCMYLVMNVQKQLTLLYHEKKLELNTLFEEISTFESVQFLEKWVPHTFIEYSNIIKTAEEDSNAIIKTSKEYIRNNLSSNLKARDVAAQINLSESYFTIYFKDKTGINFRDYVLQSRMNYAKKLLQEKKESISEIAYLTGYQDYRSFSRAFKNETGMTPSEYSSCLNEASTTVIL